MGKLGLHHRGELVCYAMQMGYVHVTPERVTYPGFERSLFRNGRKQKPPETVENKPA